MAAVVEYICREAAQSTAPAAAALPQVDQQKGAPKWLIKIKLLMKAGVLCCVHCAQKKWYTL